MNEYSKSLAECKEAFKKATATIPGLFGNEDFEHDSVDYFLFSQGGPSEFVVSSRIFSVIGNRDVFLYVKSTGIWPSQENWSLFYTVRSAIGDVTLLREGRGNILRREYGDVRISILQVCMLNGWDFFLFCPQGDFAFFFSHDQWFRCFIDPKKDNGITQTLQKLFRKE